MDDAAPFAPVDTDMCNPGAAPGHRPTRCSVVDLESTRMTLLVRAKPYARGMPPVPTTVAKAKTTRLRGEYITEM